MEETDQFLKTEYHKILHNSGTSVERMFKTVYVKSRLWVTCVKFCLCVQLHLDPIVSLEKGCASFYAILSSLTIESDTKEYRDFGSKYNFTKMPKETFVTY